MTRARGLTVHNSLGVVLCCAVGFLIYGALFAAIGWSNLAWTVGNCVLLIPFAMAMTAAGARYLPAAEVSLLVLLEVVLTVVTVLTVLPVVLVPIVPLVSPLVVVTPLLAAVFVAPSAPSALSEHAISPQAVPVKNTQRPSPERTIERLLFFATNRSLPQIVRQHYPAVGRDIARQGGTSRLLSFLQ